MESEGIEPSSKRFSKILQRTLLVEKVGLEPTTLRNTQEDWFSFAYCISALTNWATSPIFKKTHPDRDGFFSVLSLNIDVVKVFKTSTPPSSEWLNEISLNKNKLIVFIFSENSTTTDSLILKLLTRFPMCLGKIRRNHKRFCVINFRPDFITKSNRHREWHYKHHR